MRSLRLPSLGRALLGADWRKHGMPLWRWALLLSLVWAGTAHAAPPTALRFDGNGDYVTAADPTAFNTGTSDFTVMAWFKADPASVPNDQSLVSKSLGGPYGGMYAGYRIVYYRSTGQVRFLLSDGVTWGDVWGTASFASAGEWHHVAAMRAGTDLRIYLDGQLVGTRTNSVSASFSVATSYPLAIGAAVYWGVGTPFRGEIDGVAVYKRSLDRAELVQEITVGLTAADPSRVARYSFDQSLTTDDSGNAHALTLAGDVKATSGAPWTLPAPGQVNAEPPGGARARYRADRCLADAAGLVTCEDMSGNGFTATAVDAAHSPTVEAARIGAQPALVAKRDQSLRFGNPSAVLGPNFTMIVVGQHMNTNAGAQYLALKPATATSGSAVLRMHINMGVFEHAPPSAGGGAAFQLSAYGWTGVGTDGIALGESFISVATSSSDGSSFYMDNGQPGTGGRPPMATTTTPSWPLALNGTLADGQQIPAGQTALTLAEAIVYDRKLSKAELDRVYAYARRRYGLAYMASYWQNNGDIAVNGSFETDTSQWLTSRTGGVEVPEMLTRDTQDTWHGSAGSARVSIAPPAGATWNSHNTGVLCGIRTPILAGTTLRVRFAARSVSGATWLTLIRPNGGGQTFVRISNAWQEYDAYVYMYQFVAPAAGVMFSAVAKPTESLQQAQPAVFLLDDVRISVVANGHADMLYNRYFETGGSNWLGQKENGSGLVSAPEMAQAGHWGDEPADSVNTLQIKVVTDPQFPYRSNTHGAIGNLITPAKAGSVLHAKLLAKHYSGSNWLAFSTPGNSQTVVKQLTGAWESHDLYLPISADATKVIFSIVGSDTSRTNLADGQIRIDDVEVTVLNPPAGALARFRADRCATNALGQVWCEDLSGSGNSANALTALDSPVSQSGAIGGRSMLLFDGAAALKFGDPPAQIGPSYTTSVVGEYFEDRASLLVLNPQFGGTSGTLAMSTGYPEGNILTNAAPPDGIAGSLDLTGYVCESDRSRPMNRDEPFIAIAATSASGLTVGVNGAVRTKAGNLSWSVPLDGVVGALSDIGSGSVGIAEALVYDHALSAKETDALYEYARRHYGIAVSTSCAPLACNTASDCTFCGDGVITGAEQCDTALDPGCNASCSGPITNAATELSCVDHADNDSDGLIDCADQVDCNLHSACRADLGQSCASDYDCEQGVVCNVIADSTCQAPQCQNGVRDENETGRDCGGACPACSGRQCDTVCRLGEAAPPQSMETLRFAGGSFARGSTATYDGANGHSVARANELRWIGSGPRLGLFEGASTNLVRWSEDVSQASTWIPAGAGAPAVQANVAAAPNGAPTADVIAFQSGSARGPLQAISAPTGAATFSVFLRRTSGSETATTRTVITSGTAALAIGEWPVGPVWMRRQVAFSQEGGTELGIAQSHAGGWPSSEQTALGASDLAVWGVQLEAQPFATSYIPTEATAGSRQADSLVFSNPPTWVKDGQWQIDVKPLFGSHELRSDWRYTLVSFGSSSDLALVRAPDGTAALLVARYGAQVVSSAPLQWEQGAILTITVDHAQDRITVSGAESGNGATTCSGLSFSGATLRIGGALGGQGEAFAGISEPRRVGSVAASCLPDASCTCGNGVLEPGEECDSALTSLCDEGCARIAFPTLGQTDLDCPNGQVLGLNVGARFGLATSADVCWPALCTTQAASHCGGTDAPCGACECIPNCAGKTCGGDLSDGCGNTCPGICAAGQGGATNERDCAPGLVFAEDMGPRFGFAEGTSVCWPLECDDYDATETACGSTSSPCGVCPLLANSCYGRVCGKDTQEHSCGECEAGFFCTDEGTCEATPPAVSPTFPQQASHPPKAGVDPVGSIPGSFSVTQNGTAAYHVPIEVPPGRDGLQPQLALDYDSAAGDGIAGQGWSIGGISTISLCNRTVAQNNSTRGVRGDGQDPYCLDGQQLVRVGTFDGMDEYRTEFDTFVRVLAVGAEYDSDNFYHGPSSFRVQTKDGRTLFYGENQSARSWAKVKFRNGFQISSKVRSFGWHLERVQDRHGNVMAIQYGSRTQRYQDARAREIEEYVGEVRPHTIIYGDHGSHRIEFSYKKSNRYWYPRRFAAGVGTHTSTPLEYLTTRVYGEIVRSYHFETSRTGESWRLDRLTLAAPSSTGLLVELPSTVFTYAPPLRRDWELLAETTNQSGRIELTQEIPGDTHGNQTFLSNLSYFPRAVADFNNDGRDDLLHVGNNTVYLKAVRTVASEWDWATSLSLGVVDATGRGFISTHHKVGCGVARNWDVANPFLRWCDGDIWRLSVNGHSAGLGVADYFWLLDNNDDGQVDLVGCRDGDWFTVDNAHLRACNSDQCPMPRTPLPEVTEECIGSSLDVDGDGQKDLLVPRGQGRKSGSVLDGSQLRSWGRIPFGWDYGKTPFVLLDANGDGLKDAVAALRDENTLALYLNTGDGFASFRRMPLLADIDEHFEQAFAVDGDGDGRDELMVPSQTRGVWVRFQPMRAVSGPDSWERENTTIPYRFVHKRKRWKHFRERAYTAWDWQKPTPMDWDGDGVDEVVMRGGSDTQPVFQIWKLGTGQDWLLTNVRDGAGQEVIVSYADKAGDLAYLPREGACPARQQCFKRLPSPVVKEHIVQGDGGPFRDPQAPMPSTMGRRYVHTYIDGRADAQGRGWLGFAQRLVDEYRIDGSPSEPISRTLQSYDVDTYVEADRVFPFAGVPYETIVNRGDLRNTVTTEWHVQRSASGRPFVVDEGVIDVWSNGVSEVSKEVTVNVYDDYGNVVSSTVGHADAVGWVSSKTVSTHYIGPARGDEQESPQWSAFHALWLVAQPERVTSDAIGNLGTSIDRKHLESTFSYYDNGNLMSFALSSEMADGSLQWENSTQYLAYEHGHPTIEIHTARDAPTTAYAVDYGPSGIYPESISNSVHLAKALEPTYLAFDARTGALEQEIAPDGSATMIASDALGRTHSIWHTSGVQQEVSYSLGGDGRFRVVQAGAGQPRLETEFNAFGQPVLRRSTTAEVEGVPRTSVVEIGYNSMGQRIATSTPHFAGTAAPSVHRFAYDLLGRVRTEEHPWVDELNQVRQATTLHEWSTRTGACEYTDAWKCQGLRSGVWSHDVYDPQSNRTRDFYDAAGRHIGVEGPDGLVSLYQYGALGTLRTAQPYGPGETHTFTSDAFGRTIRYEAPGRTLESHFDGFGQLAESSRNGRWTTFSYDGLGRTILETSPDTTYEWRYDGDGPDAEAGHLTYAGSTSTLLGNSSTTYVHNGPGGQLSRLTQTVEGIPFTFDFTYAAGKLDTLTYPSIGGQPLVVDYDYDSYGSPKLMREGSSGPELWRRMDVDQFGAASRTKLGGVFDQVRELNPATGLPQRISAGVPEVSVAISDEQLRHDNRGLLAHRQRQNSPAEQFVHDSQGRLKEHLVGQNVLSYVQDARGNLRSKPGLTSINYDHPVHHDAVTSTSANDVFEYDADGRQNVRSKIDDPTARQEVVSFAEFDHPTAVLIGPDGSPSERRSYRYDSDKRRVAEYRDGDLPEHMVELKVLDLIRWSRRAGGFEEVARVMAPDGTPIEVVAPPTQSRRTRVMLTDHLGSVTHVLGTTEGLIESRTSEPYGQMSSSASSPATALGFTGHELGSDGVVDMKGRLYDPRVGRFLTPDPIVQAPFNAQSWNRYAYVFNSPMNLVDPDGFQAVNAASGTPVERAPTVYVFDPGHTVIGRRPHGPPGTSPSVQAKAQSKWNGTTEEPTTVSSSAPKSPDTGLAQLSAATAQLQTVLVVQAVTQSVTVPSPFGTLPTKGFQANIDPVANAGSGAAVRPHARGNSLLNAMVESPHLKGLNGDVYLWGEVGIIGGAGAAWASLEATLYFAGRSLLAKLTAIPATIVAPAAVGGGTAAQKTFKILDGVRRSKAAELAGKGTIRAEVIGTGGKVVEVPIGALRSPKAAIDASSGATLSRWLNTLKQTLGGSEPPPILVQPGASGTPIPNVTVIY